MEKIFNFTNTITNINKYCIYVKILGEQKKHK